MRIIRHCELAKDFKNLKRFPAPIESLEAWERLFCLIRIEGNSGH